MNNTTTKEVKNMTLILMSLTIIISISMYEYLDNFPSNTFGFKIGLSLLTFIIGTIVTTIVAIISLVKIAKEAKQHRTPWEIEHAKYLKNHR